MDFLEEGSSLKFQRFEIDLRLKCDLKISDFSLKLEFLITLGCSACAKTSFKTFIDFSTVLDLGHHDK